MMYHLVHALILTPFEALLTPLEWNTVAAQDYPMHVLYCKELNRVLFHSDPIKNDCMKQISEIYSLLEKFAIDYTCE